MLKTKTIKTDKATLLVVELPEGGKRISGIACDITGHFILWDDGGSYHDDNIPHGQFRIDDNPRNKWKLLGRIPDVTELLAVTIVESIEYPFLEGEFCYPDYTVYRKTGFKAFDTAIESLLSLLQANEVYFENPIPPFKERLKDWQEAQSKVWDKERTYILTKVD